MLSLNVDLINQEIPPSFHLSDTTFRCDGLSIGRDYTRIEGRTLSRGELLPELLTVEKSIGRGAFSTVHRALWKSQAVAVKSFCLLESSDQRRAMLVKELRALAKVDCETLVHLHGAFLETDTVTMVLELLDRGSLHDFIILNGPLDEKLLAPVAYQMTHGLAYLHQGRMLHRDLKPENVLMNSNGAVKLCDFGLAALGDQSLSTTVLGTTKFMAPERLRALPYGRSSDVWSLGLVMWQSIAGEAPWKDVNSLIELLVTVEEAVAEKLVPDNVSPGLREILLACLQQDPGTCIFVHIIAMSVLFLTLVHVSQAHPLGSSNAVSLVYDNAQYSPPHLG